MMKTGKKEKVRRCLYLLLPVVILATSFFQAVAQKESTSLADVSPNLSSGSIRFNRDVRPILSENCYSCHGPDEHSREAGLRLDIEDYAFADRTEGGPAIVRGNADASSVYKRIISDLKSDVMPPPNSHKTLNGVEIGIIRQWINEGAQWEKHWAFIKPKHHDVPSLSWGNNDIDKFIFRKMQDADLSPNPEAERATLARRLSLDLTGLPPSYDEVEYFVNDKAPNAYEKYVNLLLSKVAYGEHQARYWLDYVRYADTHGLHWDNYREIWPYRDWVINAFNENKSYDEFVIEQIAGDLLPNPTRDQLVATGYNRCNLTSNEGGSIADELQVRYVEDRVATTSAVMLGLTMQCAACHDHKFDPISQKDFYQFAAFFNNLESSVWDRNERDHKPVAVIPPPELEEKLNEIEPKLLEYEKQFKQIREENPTAFYEWYSNADSTIKTSHYDQNTVVELKDADSFLNPIAISNASEVLDADKPFTLYVQASFENFDNPVIPLLNNFDGDRGVRMNLVRGYYNDLPYYTLQIELIHSLKNENLISVTSSPREIIRSGVRQHFTITYDGSSRASGVRLLYLVSNGRQTDLNPLLSIDRDLLIDNLSGTIHSEQPFTSGIGNNGERADNFDILEIRIFDKHLYPFETTFTREDYYRQQLQRIREGALATLPQELFENYFFKVIHPEYNQLKYEQAAMEAAFEDIYARSNVSLISKEKESEPHAYVLDRGEYDKKGERVIPGIPSALGTLSEDMPKNRLGLARWMVDPENPLTARVAVNRFWQNLFGAGLVKTADDFGIMGENPSHPELLDYLAIYFIESGWDVKAVLKYIVMSATYRQSSKAGPEKWEADRENTFLARGPRFRLDAEVIRDQALFASNLLVDEVGGPPVKPYQPKGIWSAVGYTDSNTANYKQDIGNALHRRSLYTFWKRTAPPPNMVVFDAPSRESCTVRRERTNTPMQALTLMNDPQYVESALNLAWQSLSLDNADPKVRIDYMYRRVFGIKPLKKVSDVLERSFELFYKEFRNDPKATQSLLEAGEMPPSKIEDPAQKAAMTLVANQIMNLDSFVTKY